MLTPLKKLTIYDRRTFPTLTITHLETPLSHQIKKIQSTSKLSDQQLLLLVLNNHLKAIIDLRELSNSDLRSEDGIIGRRSFNDKGNVELYQEIAQEFFDNDQQLNKLIILNKDFEKTEALI